VIRPGELRRTVTKGLDDTQVAVSRAISNVQMADNNRPDLLGRLFSLGARSFRGTFWELSRLNTTKSEYAENRFPPGLARSSGLEDPSETVWLAWLRHHVSDQGMVGRGAPRRRRHALSGAAPDGGGRLDPRHMGDESGRAKGPRLRVDGGRPETACCRGIPLAGSDCGCKSCSEDGLICRCGPVSAMCFATIA